MARRQTTWYRPFTPKCVGIIQSKLGIELSEEQIARGKATFNHKSRWPFRGEGLVFIERANCGPCGGPANGITVKVMQPRPDVTMAEFQENPEDHWYGVCVFHNRGTIRNLNRLLDELLLW